MAKLNQHLKNYFVPHEGNNHIPHALKPKRLIFHVAGAIAVKLIVVAFISFFPLRAWLSTDTATSETKKIISLTNELRLSLNLLPLKENFKLNQAASDKVADMFLGQYFAHVSPVEINLESFIKKAGYIYSMAGENLAMGFGTAPEVMAAWEKSPTHYANLTDANFQDIGVAMSVGNFEKVETTLVAQYFGRPKGELAAAAVESAVKKIVLPPKQTTLTVKVPPVGADKIIHIEVKLPENTAAATASVNNINLELSPQGDNNWQGNALVTKEDEKAIVNPIVPASVKITNTDGGKELAALDWDSVVPAKASVYDQYVLFRRNPSLEMKTIMGFSNIYFLFLLGLVSSALLSFIILRKKQHHHILASSLVSVAIIFLLVIV